MPHYRIDDIATSKPIQAFDFVGEPFPGYRPAKTEGWSTKSMTFEGVQQLLGELRSVKAARPSCLGARKDQKRPR